MFEKIERFVFFPVVRTVAIITASIMFLIMVGGLVFVITFHGPKKEKINIAFSEIQNKVSPKEEKEDNVQIKIPENVKKYFAESLIRAHQNLGNRRQLPENIKTAQEIIDYLIANDILDVYLDNAWENWRFYFATDEEADDFMKNMSKVEDILQLWVAGWWRSGTGGGWLSGNFESAQEVNDYLKSMSRVVTIAERKGAENVQEKYDEASRLYFHNKYLKQILVSRCGEKEAQKINIPQNLEKYARSIIKILREEEEEKFKTPRETNDFLKNMSEIISEAEKKDSENVSEYIDEYGRLYFEKRKNSVDDFGLGRLLGSEASELVSLIKEHVSKFVIAAIKSIVVFAIIILFITFTLIIVLLSLLSIEKNTRKGNT